MSNKKIKAIASLIVLLGAELEKDEENEKHEKQRKKPDYWVQHLFLDRDSCGFYAKMCNMEDINFKRKMRMSRLDFNFILERVTPYIKKENTHMRTAIGPAERLAVTIRYLATGGSMQVMSDVFRLSPTSVFRIVHETCAVIYSTLKEDFLKVIDGRFYFLLSETKVKK